MSVLFLDILLPSIGSLSSTLLVFSVLSSVLLNTFITLPHISHSILYLAVRTFFSYSQPYPVQTNLFSETSFRFRKDMKRVALIACVKAKRDRPTEARKLCTSTWFKKARTYAESGSDTWRILSAKHGVLHPDKVTRPYDQSLRDLSAQARREWALGVLESLKEILSPEDVVVILAGRIYRQNLTGPIEQMVAEVAVPMEGLGIGEQLRFLNEYVDQ